MGIRAGPHASRAGRSTSGARQRRTQAGVFRKDSQSGDIGAAMGRGGFAAGTGFGVAALSANGFGHADQGLADDPDGFPDGIADQEEISRMMGRFEVANNKFGAAD